MITFLTVAGVIASWLAINTGAAFFQIEDLNLQNAVRFIRRRYQAHIRCHVGDFVLFRGDGRGGFHRVPVSIKSALAGLTFCLTPPCNADEAISGRVSVTGHHLIFTCPRNPAAFSAILWIKTEHVENYRLGVFSGTMVDNSPYSGRAVMVPQSEQISDSSVMSLLEQDQITIIDQQALASLEQHVLATKARLISLPKSQHIEDRPESSSEENSPVVS